MPVGRSSVGRTADSISSDGRCGSRPLDDPAEPDPDLRIRWKLFETQINGGIQDCCVCLLNGVPYPDANYAKRINAGLFIVDLISRARGISAPIFIDNRESVNQLYETGAQIINLVVTKDKALRIETQKSKSEEVA